MDINTNIGIISIGVGVGVLGVLSGKKIYNLTKLS